MSGMRRHARGTYSILFFSVLRSTSFQNAFHLSFCKTICDTTARYLNPSQPVILICTEIWRAIYQSLTFAGLHIYAVGTLANICRRDVAISTDRPAATAWATVLNLSPRRRRATWTGHRRRLALGRCIQSDS